MIIYKGLFPIGQQTVLNVNTVIGIAASDGAASKKAIKLHEQSETIIDLTGKKSRKSIVRVSTSSGEALYISSLRYEVLCKRYSIALSGKIVSNETADDNDE